METCKAILEQGKNKGQNCWRPAQECGYCGIHQKQHVLNNITDGKKKCNRHRCNTFVDNHIAYCEECVRKKEEQNKEKTFCKASIEVGNRRGKQCTKEANESGYCGKHQPRHTLLEEAKENNIRICDDGKRACKNQTTDNQLLCDTCLEKNRVKEREQYHERLEQEDVCLTCGVKLEEKVKDLRHERELQKCKSCVEKHRKYEIQRERMRSERNFKNENKRNINSYYNKYITDAKRRNIIFKLNQTEFEEIISKPCVYCGHYKEDEVNGIDRIDSDKHYQHGNVVPCCEMCNIMKGRLSINDFIGKVKLIYNNIENIQKLDEQPKDLPNRVYIDEVCKMYEDGNIQGYITSLELHKTYSGAFIEKLKQLSLQKINKYSFKKEFQQILRFM